MMNKEQIVALLKDRLNSVYCDTCEGDIDDNCEGCNRKAMNWGISDHTCSDIADRILEGG